jgi:hypothetical protein
MQSERNPVQKFGLILFWVKEISMVVKNVFPQVAAYNSALESYWEIFEEMSIFLIFSNCGITVMLPLMSKLPINVVKQSWW